MLVDLGRNDVGRVAQIGTVQVTKYMEIEKYKFVMHIVSEVTGKLREDAHLVDVLASSLPAGTVSKVFIKLIKRAINRCKRF